MGKKVTTTKTLCDMHFKPKNPNPILAMTEISLQLATTT
jgi:hypothetical protein